MGTFFKLFIDQFKFVSEHNGGTANPAAWWMIILAIIAFFSLAMIIDRIVVLFKTRIDYKNFWDPFFDYMKQGKTKEAISISDKYRHKSSPLAEIVYRGLRAKEISDGYSYDFAVHEAMLEIYPKLRKKVNFLTLFQSIATLIGLAGTIFGLILAFNAVGSENAGDSSQMLAAGISAAMGTTICGLLIAIPTMMAASIISYKMEFNIKMMTILARKRMNLILKKQNIHSY